jgi:hypothetical protein
VDARRADFEQRLREAAVDVAVAHFAPALRTEERRVRQDAAANQPGRLTRCRGSGPAPIE